MTTQATTASLLALLGRALEARAGLFDPHHLAGFRLFNGFLEGNPELAIDLYARTILIHDYASLPGQGQAAILAASDYLSTQLPWLRCIIVKTRSASTHREKLGRVLWGSEPDDRVHEHGVWYALDLLMNRDASLYLDTRSLRNWIIENLRGKTVLNAFAYTGSLGVAARAAGAERVVQLDRNRIFLNLAKTSYTLNGFRIDQDDFQCADFWPRISQLRRSGQTFDCVLLDPPFFSSTGKGRVDLQNNSARLINKVRPLINDDGYLVTINNALFVSGKQYLQTLQGLCADGYLSIEQLIAVSEDFTGYAQTRVNTPPSDPAPFNHPTKIAVLRVRRKTPALSARVSN